MRQLREVCVFPTLFHTFATLAYVAPASIAVDNNQNVCLSGYIEELNPSTGPVQIGHIGYDCRIIAKYDKNWNWVWIRNDEYNALHYRKTDASGDIYTTGGANYSAGVNKLTADGALVWTKSITAAYAG